jgi:hypothetical protein
MWEDQAGQYWKEKEVCDELSYDLDNFTAHAHQRHSGSQKEGRQEEKYRHGDCSVVHCLCADGIVFWHGEKERSSEKGRGNKPLQCCKERSEGPS